MSIIEIELDYASNKVLKAMTPEDYSELKTQFLDLGLPDNQEMIQDYMHYTLHGTESEFWRLCDKGLIPKAKRIRGMSTEKIPNALNIPPSTVPVQIVNVSVPNAALFQVQTLDYMENACTNSIQMRLDQGWRIVAVCPPNDCRRPTYILGHFEKDPRY